jgi:hypothetical protein
MEERLVFLEKFTGESADKFTEHKATIETRLEYMETCIGDSADKHAAEIGKLHESVKACATKENHANLEQRMAYLEKFFCESAYEHEKQIEDTKKIFLVHKNKMEAHLEYIENLLREIQGPVTTISAPMTTVPPVTTVQEVLPPVTSMPTTFLPSTSAMPITTAMSPPTSPAKWASLRASLQQPPGASLLAAVRGRSISPSPLVASYAAPSGGAFFTRPPGFARPGLPLGTTVVSTPTPQPGGNED